MNRWFQTLEFGPKGQRTNRTDSSGLWIDWGRTSGVSLKLWPILADLIKLNEDAGAAKRTIRRGPHKASNSLGPWRRRVAWYRQVRNPCEDAFCSTNKIGSSDPNKLARPTWNHRRRVSSETRTRTYFTLWSHVGSYLVDPASSHMLVSKIKPCMSKYKYCTAKLQTAH